MESGSKKDDADTKPRSGETTTAAGESESEIVLAAEDSLIAIPVIAGEDVGSFVSPIQASDNAIEIPLATTIAVPAPVQSSQAASAVNNTSADNSVADKDEPSAAKIKAEQAAAYAKERAGGAAEAAKVKAGEASAYAKEKAGEAAAVAKVKAGEASAYAKEKAGEASIAAKEKAGELATAAKSKAEQASTAAKEKAGEIAIAARSKAEQAATYAKERAGGITTAASIKSEPVSAVAKENIGEIPAATQAQAEEASPIVQKTVEEGKKKAKEGSDVPKTKSQDDKSIKDKERQ